MYDTAAAWEHDEIAALSSDSTEKSYSLMRRPDYFNESVLTSCVENLSEKGLGPKIPYKTGSIYREVSRPKIVKSVSDFK